MNSTGRKTFLEISPIHVFNDENFSIRFHDERPSPDSIANTPLKAKCDLRFAHRHHRPCIRCLDSRHQAFPNGAWSIAKLAGGCLVLGFCRSPAQCLAAVVWRRDRPRSSQSAKTRQSQRPTVRLRTIASPETDPLHLCVTLRPPIPIGHTQRSDHSTFRTGGKKEIQDIHII